MAGIRVLAGETARAHVPALAAVLLDCVRGGASVGFMSSLTLAEASSFFDSVCDEVEAGRRLLLAAFEGAELVGTVQLVLAMPPNQPHRGEIAKLLVHRSARGRGVGAALMARVESEASTAGKTLLLLDTVTGEPGERLYARLGWSRVGEVPNYALYPDGTLCSTTFFYKQLSSSPPTEPA